MSWFLLINASCNTILETWAWFQGRYKKYYEWRNEGRQESRAGLTDDERLSFLFITQLGHYGV